MEDSDSGDNKPEAHDNSLRIEVTPLRADVAHGSAPATSMRDVAAITGSRRRHLARTVGVAGAVLAIVLALTLSLAPTRDALRGAIFGPTPIATARVPFGEDLLYITLNPAWGTVSLDGMPIAKLPAVGVNKPLHISRGRHMLHWSYAPIIDYTCVLNVPIAVTDTCPRTITAAFGVLGLASLVTLQLSLKTVATTHRAALIDALQRALDAESSSEVVRSGELYWGDSNRLQPITATQSLQATLRFVLDVNDNPPATCPAFSSGPGTGCMMSGDCREICTLAGLPSSLDATGAWHAFVVAHASWLITTRDGRVIVSDQPDIGGELQFLGNDASPMPVAVRWDGFQWQASADFGAHASGNIINPFGDPACLPAIDEVAYGTFNPITSGSTQWLYMPGTPQAQGCLAADVPTSALGTPTVNAGNLSSAGLVLHRFGVALAANATAHSAWPFLPVADTYEQQIASQLAKQLPGMGSAG